VTNEDQEVVWRAVNKAFDRKVVANKINDLNLGFPGQYWDEEKQSWYNGFRDYDSSIGRYLQSDPIGVGGGLNTYNYVLGNPLVLIDQVGLLPAGGPGGGFVDDLPTSSGSYSPSSFYDNVIVPSLNSVGLYSPEAAQLMLAIAIHESNLQYDTQIGGGPALGLLQMEPLTHDDIWENVISLNSELEDKVNALLNSSDKLSELQHNDSYAVAMARIHFIRFSEELPALGDIQGMAEYWKKYYNTADGAGTVEQFLNDWYRITGCIQP
jgi:RHS repeat-associated protein